LKMTCTVSVCSPGSSVVGLIRTLVGVAPDTGFPSSVKTTFAICLPTTQG
jgi:hypothetical protein